MRLKDLFRIHLPEKPVQVKTGIYPFRREAGGKVTRFHLRVERDGSGVLLANASVAARLSPTGVLIAKARLEGVAYPVISKMIKENFYGASETQIESDVRKITRMIGELANLEDNYPVFNLDDPAIAPPQNLIAPFHAQLPSAAPETINPLLQKLWDSGILHVTFAIEQTGESFAVQNVERAEDLGMISGVRALAGWFLHPGLFEKLALAGIDYIMIPSVSTDPQKQDPFFGENSISDGNECYQLCSKWEVTPVLEVPIFRRNGEELEHLMSEFSSRGGRNILFYAIADEHQPEGLNGIEIIRAASLVAEVAHRLRVRYVWLPAVSMSGDLKSILRRGPRTAGDVSIRVDQDGSVYAPRGPLEVAGNLSKESFYDIWSREIFERYRERVSSPTRCEICPELEVCGADCPGDPKGWARGGVA